MAKLRVAHGERVEVEGLRLDGHRIASAVACRRLSRRHGGLLLLLLLLLLLRALACGALSRHTHVRRLLHGRHARS